MPAPVVLGSARMASRRNTVADSGGSVIAAEEGAAISEANSALAHGPVDRCTKVARIGATPSFWRSKSSKFHNEGIESLCFGGRGQNIAQIGHDAETMPKRRQQCLGQSARSERCCAACGLLGWHQHHPSPRDRRPDQCLARSRSERISNPLSQSLQLHPPPTADALDLVKLAVTGLNKVVDVGYHLGHWTDRH